MQRLRRTFAEHFAVLDGEAPQFEKAKFGGNLRYRDAFAICSQQGASCFGQPQHSKTPARRKAVDFVKRLAKGPLAYLKRSAQGRNVQWLVYMGEGQSFSLFDEIAAGVAFPSERRFRNDCEPLMNVHQKTPVERARQIGFTGHTTRQVLGRYCPLGQIGSCATADAAACNNKAVDDSPMTCFLRLPRLAASAVLHAPRWRRPRQTIEPAASASPHADEL